MSGMEGGTFQLSAGREPGTHAQSDPTQILLGVGLMFCSSVYVLF